MKLKRIIMGVLLGAAVVTAALGQVKGREFVLQDDLTGSYLSINLSTGQYRFQSCEGKGTAVEGVGKIKIKGCKVTLQDLGPKDPTRQDDLTLTNQTVLAEADLCASRGTAVIMIDPCQYSTRDCPSQQFTISDSNIRDSMAQCDAKVGVDNP